MSDGNYDREKFADERNQKIKERVMELQRSKAEGVKAKDSYTKIARDHFISTERLRQIRNEWVGEGS